MLLTVRHTTRYAYEPEATGIVLRLKLFPSGSAAQKISDWSVTVNGQEITPLLTDAAGDQSGLWHAHGPLGEVEIVAGGTVETTDTAGVLKEVRQMMPPAVYLRETALTEPSPAIRAIAEAAVGDDTLSRLHALSAAVHEAVEYTPDTTVATTTAAEAAVQGTGVCQDQSHVFISAARSLDIPARYVAGYLLDSERDEEEGEQTHAWAEAHVEGLGWVGFDITHQLCPTDAYVRLASGFDAADAAPIRGTAAGETESDLTASVHVEQTAGQSQQ